MTEERPSGFGTFLFLLVIATLFGSVGLYVGVKVLHEAIPAVQPLTYLQSVAGSLALSVVKGIPPLRAVQS